MPYRIKCLTDEGEYVFPSIRVYDNLESAMNHMKFIAPGREPKIVNWLGYEYMIKEVYDILKHDFTNNVNVWKKAMYKWSECSSIWIQFDFDQVRIGASLIEEDVDIPTRKLFFPFTRDEFWSMVDEVTEAQDDAYNEWHSQDEEE